MSNRSFRRAHARRVALQERRLARAKRRTLAVGAALGASAVLASSAQAAGNTYTVTTANDDGQAAPCSNFSCATLRDAIAAANADGQSDTIVFANSASGTMRILSGNDPLTITDPSGLTIDGPGSGALTVSGPIDGTSQLFVIQMTQASKGVPVSISGLTLQNGVSTGEGGAIENGQVNGSYYGASLSLDDVVITGSTAEDGPGGGIFSKGPLTITNSTISGNTSSLSDGGGIAARAPGLSKYQVTIDNSTISDNTAEYGGGIYGGADFTITNSEISGNTASGGDSSGGGGIEAIQGSLSLSYSTLYGNTSTYQGGGIDSDTYSGTSIDNSTISGNTATTRGGGIEIRGQFHQNPISLSTSTVSDNSAASGGGVDLSSDVGGSPVTISASTISGNTGSAEGGGILIAGTVYSPFDLIDSTISGNSASTGGGVGLGSGTNPLTGQGGSVGFDNSTIASNSASTQNGGGGIYMSAYSAGTPNLNSTIVADNSAANAGNDLSRASGSTTGGPYAAYSLIQNPGNTPFSSSQALITGVDPQLGALANNGGPTETMLPSNSSPVIDQGKAAPGLTSDQRGDPRTVDNGKPKPAGGDGTDIGSVELPLIGGSSPPPSPGPSSGTPPPSSGPSGGTPSDLTTRAAAIGTRGAAFSGNLNPDNLPTTAYFQFGLDRRYLQPGASGAQYDQQTAAQSAGSDASVHQLAATVSGLVPNAIYHVRLVAVNSAGTTYGPDVTFRTGKDPAPPPPVLGKSFDASVVSGLVFIHLPPGLTAADRLSKGVGFEPLTEARQLPAGTQIDARQGTIKLITASPQRHRTQSGNFGGGLFGMSQDAHGVSKGLTTLSLLEGLFPGAPSYSSCTATSADAFGPFASPAKLSSKVLQTLHSTAKGKFRTRGRYAAATVRGTGWTISDRCDGTLVTVQRHTVAVTDLVRHISLLVHQGHHYLAKAPRSRRR